MNVTYLELCESRSDFSALKVRLNIMAFLLLAELEKRSNKEFELADPDDFEDRNTEAEDDFEHFTALLEEGPFEKSHLFYSVVANYMPRILRSLKRKGWWAMEHEEGAMGFALPGYEKACKDGVMKEFYGFGTTPWD